MNEAMRMFEEKPQITSAILSALLHAADGGKDYKAIAYILRSIAGECREQAHEQRGNSDMLTDAARLESAADIVEGWSW